MPALEVEQPGRLGRVVAGEGEGAEDDLPLGVVDQVPERLLADRAERGGGLLLGDAQGSGARWTGRTGPGKQLPRLVAGDLGALAEDGQPLDQVPELADVSGEAVGDEGLDASSSIRMPGRSFALDASSRK